MERLDLGEDWALEWSVDGLALDAGVSGDYHVVCPFDGGALIAVLDGLGHGPEAAEASQTAGDILSEHRTAPLDQLVQLCHAGIRGTRGTVMTLVSFSSEHSQLNWCGIGNVEAFLLRPPGSQRAPREAVVCRGGVIGYQVPSVRVSSVEVEPGSLLVMATDGLYAAFSNALDVRATTQGLPSALLASHARGSDDVLVLAARFLQRRGESVSPQLERQTVP